MRDRLKAERDARAEVARLEYEAFRAAADEAEREAEMRRLLKARSHALCERLIAGGVHMSDRELLARAEELR